MEQDSENQSKYAQATDVGCVRELNEDSVHSQPGLWLVADGMGGHACGEVASAMAIEHVISNFPAKGPIEGAIQTAHEKIIEAGEANLSQAGMGTTLVALISNSTGYQVAWVGDSRAYLWDARSAKLIQLSEDHSLMVRLINAGLINEQDAKTHPQRHMITQCLGSTEIEKVKVDTEQKDWESNQQILLCSDGLTDEVSERMISEIMASRATLEEKNALLIKTAKQAGGRDNISVIIIDSPVSKPLGFIERIRAFFNR